MDYQGNSKKEKEPAKLEDKVVEKVVTGEVVTRKKPLGRRVKEVFFGGDAKNAMQYIVADVLLPAFRNVVVDASSKGIERMVYGESSAPRRSTEYRPRVTYNTPINRGLRDIPSPNRALGRGDLRPQRQQRDGTEMILASREEAEIVLERLGDIIDKYGVATMADLRDLVGLPTSHIDQKWGWDTLFEVDIRQTREGHLLDLPPAEPM